MQREPPTPRYCAEKKKRAKLKNRLSKGNNLIHREEKKVKGEQSTSGTLRQQQRCDESQIPGSWVGSEFRYGSVLGSEKIIG